jgi:predicted dienelactone hydrolase
MIRVLFIYSAFLIFPFEAISQTNRIDIIRSDAPTLAYPGSYDIGVRTIVITDKQRPDILNTKPGEDTVYYDRPLTLEIWYPADISDLSGDMISSYSVITQNPQITVTIQGRAVRDAKPLINPERHPVVIISHGYPGNRYLLAHLAEILATKGFVVVSIDHTDSTYDDQKAFASTLYNRGPDQEFVINYFQHLTPGQPGGFLKDIMDTDNIGVVGYSMGGYGVINILGGGYAESAVNHPFAPPNGLLSERTLNNAGYVKKISENPVKTGVAIGPWGMTAGLWNEETLKGVNKPILFIAGDLDDISGYENGVRAIWEKTVNIDRYLLTFLNANHNAAAPMPSPAELTGSEAMLHYTDPVWDTIRMNNILHHFVTAWFGYHLKGDMQMKEYLTLVPLAADGLYDLDTDRNPTAEHTYWKGFPNRTAAGLKMEVKNAGE